jgi:hypothetical protein
MKNKNEHSWPRSQIVALLIVAVLQACVFADRPGWQREEVAWRVTGGFVPWIAATVTDARSDILELEAVTKYSIVGNDLTNYPESDYAIGIYDTGASAHVMGNAAATKAGLFSTGNVTSNSTTISGVTGETDAWVSEPIGLFIDGLGAIEPNGLLLDRSGMMGQSNVAIMVGQGGLPDLPTAIGSTWLLLPRRG